MATFVTIPATSTSISPGHPSENRSSGTADAGHLAVESKTTNLASGSPRNIHGPACVSRRIADQHVPNNGFTEGARCVVVTQRHAAGLLAIAAVNVLYDEAVDQHKPR